MKQNIDEIALYNSLQLKLKTNNRAPFVPAAGTAPSDLQALWNGLEAAEEERYELLRRELDRQERLDLLNRNFNNRAAKLEAWIKQKQNYLATFEKVRKPINLMGSRLRLFLSLEEFFNQITK